MSNLTKLKEVVIAVVVAILNLIIKRSIKPNFYYLKKQT